jgi:choline kinase
MKTIILAAGYGSRLQPLTKDKPKCLLPISNNENMLARQLRIIKKCGITDIIIVVGYKREEIIMKYKEEVSIIFNQQYAVTGDAFSLWKARNEFDDDMIILNGDVVFTEATINDLLNESNPFSVSVEKKFCEPDDLKVEIKDGLIVNFGKGILLEKAYGEAVGIGKIKKEKIDIYRKALYENIKKNPQIRWLEVFNFLINRGEEIHFTLIKEPCFDNDTLEDYRRTREIFENKES